MKARRLNRILGWKGKKTILDTYASFVVRLYGVNFRAKAWVLTLDKDSAISWPILLSRAWMR
jgi:hypothetical protein